MCFITICRSSWCCLMSILYVHSSTFINIYSVKKSCSSFSFYLFSELYIYTKWLSDIYFILWVIIQCYHYLFCCSHCLIFGQGRDPSSWLLCPFNIPSSFLSIPYFLVPQAGLVSSHVFSDLALASAVFPRKPGSFYYRIIFKNQALGAGCVHWYWSVIASRPVQWIGNVYKY